MLLIPKRRECVLRKNGLIDFQGLIGNFAPSEKLQNPFAPIFTPVSSFLGVTQGLLYAPCDVGWVFPVDVYATFSRDVLSIKWVTLSIVGESVQVWSEIQRS